jgi:hypothetical protein
VAEFDGLKFLNERIGELILEYNTALMNNDRRVTELLDELSRLCVLRDELKKTQSITNEEEKNSLVIPRIEFSNPDAVYRSIEWLAREVADTPRANPRRLQLIEEIARLSIFVKSVKKEEN